jgi:hypothetical protein
VIKIEGHSRMIPGAEAPLNSIAQMPVLPATCSCSLARALELYTRQMERRSGSRHRSTYRPLFALIKTHFGCTKITFGTPFLRRILAAPHSRQKREEGTPRCGGGGAHRRPIATCPELCLDLNRRM